jgi:hypothetical protein
VIELFQLRWKFASLAVSNGNFSLKVHRVATDFTVNGSSKALYTVKLSLNYGAHSAICD